MIIYGLQTVKSFKVLCLEGDPYYIFILQSLQICPCTKYKPINNDFSFFLQGDLYYIFMLQYLQICLCTKYKHINNDLSFFLQGDIYFTISAYVSLYCLTLSTNILMIIFLYPSRGPLVYIYFTISTPLYWVY